VGGGAVRKVGGPLTAVALLASAAHGATAPTSTFDPRVGVDAAGDITVLWLRGDGTGPTVLEATRRSAIDGTWSRPARVAGRSNSPEWPSLAVDAVAVWIRKINGHRAVQAATRAGAAGTWTAQRTLSDPRRDADRPGVATVEGGGAAIVWSDDRAVYGALRPALRAPWTSARELGAVPFPGAPGLVTNERVDALVTWASFPRDTRRQGIYAAYGDVRGGSWGPAVEVGSANSIPNDAPALDADGNGAITWVSSFERRPSIHAATRPASTGTWTASEEVPTAGLRPAPSLNAASAGSAYVALWMDQDGDRFHLSTKAGALGPWSQPDPLPPSPGATGAAALVADPLGALHALWLVDRGRTEQLWASSRPSATSAWTPPQALSRAGRDVQGGDFRIVPSPAGGAVAVWQSTRDFTGNTPSVVQMASVAPGAPTWSAPETISPLNLARVVPRCLRPHAPGACRLRVDYVLNKRARLTITVRRADGQLVGTIRRPGLVGENIVPVPVRLGANRLTAGRYLVQVRAAAGAETVRVSEPVVLR
jgi:hypothetical protein